MVVLCSRRGRQLNAHVLPCAHCGKLIRPVNGQQKYCSIACSTAVEGRRAQKRRSKLQEVGRTERGRRVADPGVEVSVPPYKLLTEDRAVGGPRQPILDPDVG